MDKRIRNLTGQKFGKWTVLFYLGSEKNGANWLCRCDCGHFSKVAGTYLFNGKSKQCRSCANTTHGMSRTRIYHTWQGMMQRCYYTLAENYKDYGGRGIKVCERWHKFENFYADMGDKPEDKTLDRLDVNGDYCPENCRWATQSEQNFNKRKIA